MKKITIGLLARLCSLAICHFGMAVFGQGWEPAMLRFGVNDGVSDAGLFAIIVDRQNQVWMGSGKGVNLYDGNTFRTFTKRNGLVENRVLRIYEDHEGTIWCMGGENQLSYFEDGAFKPYRFNHVLRDSLPQGQNLTDFAFDVAGNLFAVFRDGKHRSIRVDSLGKYSYQSGHLPKARINAIDCGRKLLVNCQYPRGIGRVVESVENRFVITQGWGLPEEIPSQTRCSPSRVVRSEGAVRMKDGRLIVNGAWGLWGQLEVNGPMVELNRDRSTVCLMVDSDGWLWAGSYFNGVYIYHPDNLFEPMYHWFQEDGVLGIAEDQEKGIWIASGETGLYYCPNKRVLQKEREPGIPRQALSDKFGNLYQSFEGRGIRKTSQDGEVGWFDLPNCKMAIPPDSSFILFYGPTGVQVYNPLKDELKTGLLPFSFAISRGDQYSDSTLFLHFQDKLVEFGVKGIEKNWKIPIPWRHGNITKEGEWYLATDSGCYLTQGDSVRKVYPASDSVSVQVMRIQRWNELLILATNGDGLVLLDGDSAQVVTVDEGLSSDFLLNAYALDEKKIATVSNKGLDIIEMEPTVRVIRNLRAKNGFGSDGISFVIRSSDSTRFVTSSSILRLANRELAFEPKELPPPLLEIRQDGNSILSSEADFPHGQNHITFRFRNIQYQEEVEYRYQLSGLSDSWIHTKQTETHFDALPAGQYVFQVQSRSSGKNWAGKSSQFNFTIHPPFWMTWWFVGLAILAMTGIIYLLVRRKFEIDHRRNLVKNELTSLKGEALRAQMNPHFTFNALNSIQSFITGNDKEKAANFLSSFARVMRMFLEYSREDLITLDEEIVLLEEYLSLEKMRFHEKFDFSIEVAEGLNRYQCPVPPILIQPLVENALIHGVLPAKHKAELKIYFQMESESLLKCVVWDNGAGITPSKNPKEHRSLGLQLVKDRLANLEKAGLSGGKFTLGEGELHGQFGTCSTILIPAHDI